MAAPSCREAGQSLQRLAQIAIRDLQEALPALVSPLGEFPHGLYCIERHDQLGLDSLAFGHIANSGRDQGLADVLDGAEIDLEGKRGAVAPLSIEVEPGPHGAHAHIADDVPSVACELRPKAFGHQHFEVLADDFVVGVPKQGGDLAIREPDGAERVDNDYRIRGGIQDLAGESGRDCDHASSLGIPGDPHQSGPAYPSVVARPGGTADLAALNAVDDQILSQFLTGDDPLELADGHVSMAPRKFGLPS